MDHKRARQILMVEPGTEAAPHVDREAFRCGGNIFASLRADGVMNVKLPVEVQETLCAAEPAMFRPVAGGWGRAGWTSITLDRVGETELGSALQAARALSLVKRPKPRKKR